MEEPEIHLVKGSLSVASAMTMQQGILAIAIFVTGALALFLQFTSTGRRAKDLPPGPPTLPLIGNLHLMPTKRPHLQFQKWAEEYGPIYSLILGTVTTIVLSSDQAIYDLLDKKSGNFSSRPDMYLAQNKGSGGLRVVLMKYGDTWRMIHRIYHNIINIKAAVTYVPYQDLENKIMLEEFLDNPEDYSSHIRRYTFSLTTQLLFGFRCPNKNDSRLKQLFWSFERWGKLASGGYARIVDLFPLLQSLPRWLSPSVRYAEWLHKIEKTLFVGLWLQTKKALLDGTGHETEKFSDDLAGYISGSLLEASSETTAGTLHGFILAVLIWPEVQEKIQAELDRVVGLKRLPEMGDYDNLPYVRCCIKESLRWMPTTILGIPHSNVREDEYMGYRIPAGSTVINNVWAIHMDPKRSPDPRRFNPDRFAGDHTSLYESATGDYQKRDNYVFGAGRRRCQGIHIVERSMFLAISRMMWAFRFSPATDPDGVAVKYDTEDLVGALTAEPNRFNCKIIPRSVERVKVVRQAADDCRALLHDDTLQWKTPPPGMAFSTYTPEHIED